MFHTWNATRGVRLVVLCLLGVEACNTSEPAAPVERAAELTVVAFTNHQRGAIGVPLARPLQILVTRGGVPAAGVTVRWKTTAGSIIPTSSTTDATGAANTTWTLARSDTGHIVHASASLAEQPSISATFSATIAGDVALTIVSETDNQSGEVGSALSQLLRVRTTNHGAAAAGQVVLWRNIEASVRSTVSDSDGFAVLGWTLPTQAGRHSITASLASDSGMAVTLTALAHPGPVAGMRIISGDNQTVPLNATPTAIQAMVVLADDRYGNEVPDTPVAWNVESGTGILTAIERTTNRLGMSSARLAPGGVEGLITVRASSNGQSVRFVFEAKAAAYRVTYYTNTNQFMSAQNNSIPARDEVPVGATVTWTLEPFDYDQHAIVFVNGPVNPGGGDFPYGSPSQVHVKFTVPGTYRYRDSFYGAEGVVIVTPPVTAATTGKP
jgi:plastocyanin